MMNFKNRISIFILFWAFHGVAFAQPWIATDDGLIPNDQYWERQWHLHNIGQVTNDNRVGTLNVDINMPEAWLMTQGSNDIIVAVIDEGVSSNHPDLPNSRQVRLPGSNFGDSNNGGGSDNTNPSFGNTHGNACAGIIAATANNGIGIAGIAPNVRIMPIRITYQLSTSENFAEAIDFAVANGARVICNSWSQRNTGGQRFLNGAQRSAILAALDQNVVVVFSSGNDARTEVVNIPAGCSRPLRQNAGVNFPGNTDPRVLTVGACDRNGIRSVYSNNGEDLDIVAPSSKTVNRLERAESEEIWTIDIPGAFGYNPCALGNEAGDECGERDLFNRQGAQSPVQSPQDADALSYTGRFGGTSASCPQAAGVAALILSMNPCLTNIQVNNIIERSAIVLLTHAALTTTGRPNGPWNNDVGYGLLNAFDALQLTQTMYIQRRTVQAIASSNALQLFANPIGEIIAGNNVDVTNSTLPGPVLIDECTNVEFKSNLRVTLKRGFRVRSSPNCLPGFRTRFRASIQPNVNGCVGWVSTLAAPTDSPVEAEPLSAEEHKKTVFANGSSLTLYPNPNNGRFSLSYQRANVEQKEGINIQVSNGLGQLIFVQNLDAESNTENMELQLDQNNVKPGIYFLQIREGKSFSNLKFVVHEN